MMTYLLLLLLYEQSRPLPAQRPVLLLLLIDLPHPYCVPFILVFQRCREAPAGLRPTTTDFMDRPSYDSGLTIFWTPQHKLETLTITEPTVHPRIQRLWMYHLPWDNSKDPG